MIAFESGGKAIFAQLAISVLRSCAWNTAGNVFLFCLKVPGTPAAMPLEDVRTHETVHIEVGDCLIDVDGLKQTNNSNI